MCSISYPEVFNCAGRLVMTSSSSLGSRCVPWLGEDLSMSSPNYPLLCCPLPYRVAPVFARSSLHRLAGLPCRIFLSYGLQVVTRKVHRLSLRRLICPAQDHFICLTVKVRVRQIVRVGITLTLRGRTFHETDMSYL